MDEDERGYEGSGGLKLWDQFRSSRRIEGRVYIHPPHSMHAGAVPGQSADIEKEQQDRHVKLALQVGEQRIADRNAHRDSDVELSSRPEAGIVIPVLRTQAEAAGHAEGRTQKKKACMPSLRRMLFG